MDLRGWSALGSCAASSLQNRARPSMKRGTTKLAETKNPKPEAPKVTSSWPPAFGSSSFRDFARFDVFVVQLNQWRVAATAGIVARILPSAHQPWRFVAQFSIPPGVNQRVVPFGSLCSSGGFPTWGTFPSAERNWRPTSVLVRARFQIVISSTQPRK